jgi:glycopeptide antibiotics resistance protein
MPFWEYLDLDENTRKALDARDRETKRKKISLIISLAIILIIAFLFYLMGFISKQIFELIFSAFVGGFIGSALSYIIMGDK